MLTITIWLTCFISLIGLFISIFFDLPNSCIIINMTIWILSGFIYLIIHDYIYPKYLSVKLHKTEYKCYKFALYNDKYYFEDTYGDNKIHKSKFSKIHSTKVQEPYIQVDIYTLKPKNKLCEIFFIFPFTNMEIPTYTLYLPM